MGSVYKEISRLETAKQDIETAIEYCGVNVPDTELIDTYANYIRQIPSAVFSQFNADLVGGTDKFISSIKQTNGIIKATAGGLVSASYSGLVPKIGTTASATIATPADEWVLTSTKGAQPTWRKLPANAFKNDNTNTTYTLSGALSGNTFVSTLTPSSGTNTTSTVPAMTGASSSTAGKAGLVPAPASGKQASFLRGDGTWVVPTNTKNTAGSTNTTSKIFLVGTTSQASSAQTYSNSGIHATDGVLTASGFVGNLTGNVTGNVSGSAGSVSWGNVTGKPTTFTPSAHNHDDLYYRKANVYTKTETNTELSKKLDKITYEFNKELALGGDGKVCIGKFPMYDSNITVDINSTTNTTYHGTLVIATQNINTTGGGSYTATVYGDASNTLTGDIKIKYVSGSNLFEVYINLPGWSKNSIHVKCVALAGAPTNIVEKVSSIPSNATIVPVNALTTTFVSKTNENNHNHATNAITALTGYTIATSAAALATSDSLNKALGKLEYKANLGKTAYDWYKSVTGTDNDAIINKWEEIVSFIDSVKEGTDILDEFVTRKTAQTITGLKTFESNASTTGVSLILKNSEWTGNMSTAMDFYNGKSYSVPNARIETKMVGSGSAGGTLIFYTQTKHASTNPNPNGLTERFRIDDNGASKITGTFTVTGNTTAAKFITSGGTRAQFVKGDGSLDSTVYATSASLANYVTLAGVQTISGKKTFSNGLAITGGATERTDMPYFLGIDAYADGGSVRYLSAAKVCAAIGAAKTNGSNATGTWGISITGNAATATNAATANRATISDNGVFYIAGTGSTAGTWLGSHSGITSYYTGLTIAYKIPVKGADTTTININNLGAKTIKRNDSNLTTHVPVNSVILLVYDGTYFRWSDYDANSYAYVRQYLTNSNNTEYPLLFRYDTEAPSSTYVTKYTRYDSAITVNPSTNTITATIFNGTATNASKLNGKSASYYAAADSLSNYVHKTVGGVQSILGGLVIGASSDESQAVGRIMLTGNSNPLIGIRATGGTAFYFQSTGDIMYLGPTSSKALSFVGSTGVAAFPSTVTSSGFIKSGSSASYVLLGDGGHKAISDFLLKTELPAEELKSNVTTITKKLTVTQDWMDVGIAGTNLPANGTYIVQVSVTANDSTGNMWNCLWSGVMSWHKDATNDTDSDEILLHRSGHAYGNTLYLRTVMRSNSTLKLQIAANTNIGKAYTYTFKFKRIL